MVFTIIGVGLIGVFLFVVFKELKPSIATMVSLAAGSLILVICLELVSEIISKLTMYLAKINVSSEMLYFLFKVVGISFLVEFIADIAEECGSKAIASKIALGGKVIITGISLPILFELLDVITGLL